MKNIILISVVLVLFAGCAHQKEYTIGEIRQLAREYVEARHGKTGGSNALRDYSGIAPSQPTQYYIDQYSPTRQINPMPSRHSYHIGNKHYICHTYGMSDITYCN